MILTNLSLDNFRSYHKRKFVFEKPLTIIIGPNTSGKTNIFESIFLLATGKSFRADKDIEMIAFENALGRVIGQVKTNNDEYTLELVVTRGELYGRRIFSKRYLINGVPRRIAEFVGKLKVSLFWPQDLELITDSPGIRRKYLDFVLIQLDKSYAHSLRIYEKALRFRNKLLEKIREGQAERRELVYWNSLLITNGSYLNIKRREYLEFLNNRNSSMNNTEFKVVYDQSAISPERLEQYKEEEVRSATTLVGPHRDDFEFRIKNQSFGFVQDKESRIRAEKNLSVFGSRGEQRMGVLWLKLGELAFIKEKSGGEEPVLLLDDIFSEFDHENRQLVFKHIGNQQTIITTTDIHLIEEKLRKKAQIIELT